MKVEIHQMVQISPRMANTILALLVQISLVKPLHPIDFVEDGIIHIYGKNLQMFLTMMKLLDMELQHYIGILVLPFQQERYIIPNLIQLHGLKMGDTYYFRVGHLIKGTVIQVQLIIHLLHLWCITPL